MRKARAFLSRLEDARLVCSLRWPFQRSCTEVNVLDFGFFLESDGSHSEAN